MRFYLLIISGLIFFTGKSQGFKVRHLFPGASSAYSGFIFETAPGNYIAGGLIMDTVHGFTINRLAIMGLDNNGAVQWEKKYGNEKLIYVNNPFITRSFYKQGNFIYYACCMLDSNNNYVGALTKIDLNGDTLWQKIYRDTVQNDLVPQMVTGSVDGGFLITGYCINSNPCLLIKTDATGNELWRKKIGLNTVCDGEAIVQDSASKKIVIAGYILGYANSVHDNIFILDDLGNLLSQHNYMSTGGVMNDLIQTQDKKIIAVGYHYYPQTIGGNHLMRSFAVKFDFNNPSVPIWKIDGFDQLTLGNAFGTVNELANGDILINGLLDTMQLHNQPINSLIRITRFDKDGLLISNRYYDYKINDSVSDNRQGIVSLEPTSDGGYVAAIKVLNVPTPNPFFFVKYDSTGCDSSLAYCAALNLTAVKKYTINDSEIQIYPNPVKDILNVEIKTPGQTEKMELSLSDVYGREVKHAIITQSNKIDVQELKSNIYFLSLKKNGNTVYTTKLIKE